MKSENRIVTELSLCYLCRLDSSCSVVFKIRKLDSRTCLTFVGFASATVNIVSEPWVFVSIPKSICTLRDCVENCRCPLGSCRDRFFRYSISVSSFPSSYALYSFGRRFLKAVDVRFVLEIAIAIVFAN
ncbi:hypothetical protein QTP88_023956 [Uroleucon formosanum]